VLKYNVKNKLITIEHNYIKYLYSYMFRPPGAIIRLAFGTYKKGYTYRIVEVISYFLQIHKYISKK